jgi:hypothetical protein
MKAWIASLASLALIGGCVKMDSSPPKDLPDYVKLYPGAQPTMTMALGPLSSEVETTPDKPDAVIAFYRTQAASDGLTETQPASSATANASPGQLQAQFGDPAQGKILVVIAKPQGASTMISLTYKPVKAPS